VYCTWLLLRCAFICSFQLVAKDLIGILKTNWQDEATVGCFLRRRAQERLRWCAWLYTFPAAAAVCVFCLFTSAQISDGSCSLQHSSCGSILVIFVGPY